MNWCEFSAGRGETDSKQDQVNRPAAPPSSPRPAADVLVVGPGGSYNNDLDLLAVFVELFGGINCKEHCFRLALVRTVFFVIELDHPNVVVGG